MQAIELDTTSSTSNDLVVYWDDGCLEDEEDVEGEKSESVVQLAKIPCE